MSGNEQKTFMPIINASHIDDAFKREELLHLVMQIRELFNGSKIEMFDEQKCTDPRCHKLTLVFHDCRYI